MREATSADDFIRAPVGSLLVDRTWGYLYPDDQLSGYVVWGRPSNADFERLAQILPATHSPTTTPHPLLVDLRAMDGIDPDAFHAAIRYTTQHFALLQRAITKLALVRSGGLAGALTAGFFSVAAAFSPVALFTDPKEAMAWLDREAYWSVFQDTCGYFESVRHAAPMLRDLRSFLEANPASTLVEMAGQLAISTRTLQRRLREMGTSVTVEMASARVRAAQKLLAETDLSVTEIAFQVGCKSGPHFNRLFRKAAGEAPTTWRQKQRARNS